MAIKSNNPKSEQPEITKLLELSSSTIQRFKGTNMLSRYRIPPSSKTNHTRKQKTLNTNLDDVEVTSIDLKKTSNDLKMISNESNTKPNKKNKNTLKAVFTHDKIEINEHYLDQILHNNNS